MTGKYDPKWLNFDVRLSLMNLPSRPPGSIVRVFGMGRALLVFHSPGDTVVGVDNATYIFQHARHPKSFISLAGADHLLLNEADARYVGALTADWSLRYMRPRG